MKVGRNDPCPCGSGRKYKACCLKQEQTREIPLRHKLLFAVIGLAIAASVVAIVITAVNPESADPGQRVWSEEHQHWHEVP